MDFRSFLQRVGPVSGLQFALFRLAFGFYLCLNCAYLLPYASEIFSRAGAIPDARLNYTYGLLPNPLEHWDSPMAVRVFVGAMVVLAVLYTVGSFRRTASILLWYGWACLFNRNLLINNPSLPYIGQLLLLSALVPAGEPFTLSNPGRSPTQDWYFPRGVFTTAWILMCVGYAFSGWAKLKSPSWIDGSALVHILACPMARLNMFQRAFLRLPSLWSRLATWSVLVLELGFLPLCLNRWTRLWAWGMMVCLHVMVLLTLDLADLSWGMLMLHFFTFDPRWLLTPRYGRLGP